MRSIGVHKVKLLEDEKEFIDKVFLIESNL